MGCRMEKQTFFHLGDMLTVPMGRVQRWKEHPSCYWVWVWVSSKMEGTSINPIVSFPMQEDELLLVSYVAMTEFWILNMLTKLPLPELPNSGHCKVVDGRITEEALVEREAAPRVCEHGEEKNWNSVEGNYFSLEFNVFHN